MSGTPVIRRGVADYLAMLQNLLPLGAAWSRDRNASITRLLTATGAELSRVDSEVFRLIDEADPQTTVEGIEEWERMTGLPDVCGTDADTLQERRDQVIRKLVRPVGQSEDFFNALAASLGYASSIHQFTPFCVEASGVEEDLCDAPGGAVVDATTSPPTVTQSLYDGWRFVWLLRVTESPLRYFTADSSGADDFLVTWGDTRLECIINRAKPAHTIVLFGYGA